MSTCFYDITYTSAYGEYPVITERFQGLYGEKNPQPFHGVSWQTCNVCDSCYFGHRHTQALHDADLARYAAKGQ